MAGVQKELWIGVLMKKFYPDGSFLLRSTDMSAFVEHNTINLADCGVDPNVLVNNTSYPVPVSQRIDSALALPLSTLDTENTLVRNVEEMESAYDKMGSVVSQHRAALQAKAATLAAFNYAPQQTDATNMVLATTGAGGAISFADIIALAGKYNDMDAPTDGRILVLSPAHRAQLMTEDAKLYKEIFGTGSQLFGFSVFSFSKNPTYTAGQKNAYGAAGSIASFSYLESEVMRAIGDVEMFAALKTPGDRGDIVGFQMRFAGLSIRKKYSGALVS